jgi:hypothetical protein
MKLFQVVAIVAAITGLLGISNQANAQYGSIYVSGGSTAQALATTAAKMTGFATLGATNVQDSSVTPALAADTITVKGGGRYLVKFDCTALMGTADIQVAFGLRNDTTAVAGATCAFEAEDAAVPVHTGMHWIYEPTDDAVLSIYVASESATPNLTPVHAQFSVIRID